MPKARKNPPPKPPRICPVCGVNFVQKSGRGGVQKYCDAHKNRNAKRNINLRALGAKERPADYYRPKRCAEPGCDSDFVPRTGSAKYCDADQGIDRWALRNPERAAEMGRNSQRRYRHTRAHGDADIYDKLVAEYGEKCAICGRGPEPGYSLAVDHDHVTGAIRALLCQARTKAAGLGGCNTGLGYFCDDPERLRAAARYVEHFM